MNPYLGYICVFLYRPFYFPGQTIRGFALIDAFNDIKAKDIKIRVRGSELPGKHGHEISKKLMKDPQLFHLSESGFAHNNASQRQSMTFRSAAFKAEEKY